LTVRSVSILAALLHAAIAAYKDISPALRVFLSPLKPLALLYSFAAGNHSHLPTPPTSPTYPAQANLLRQHRQETMAEHQYKFNVSMSCGGCSGAVERVLKKLDGKLRHT
jgi:hypothetical protein